MYDGTSHEFKVDGLTLLDVGITGIEATGEVYELVEAKDIEGAFSPGKQVQPWLRVAPESQ